ncbi:MAG TPA: cupin domain-containing protein [Acidimicrobiales bacterium]|nr:cupin domain-containing protein [Acidimicrobiales bacterium]
MGEAGPGATFLHFDAIDWATAGGAVGSAPAELVEAARRTGARQKRMATGERGFYMNHNEMPAGFTVPTHVHDHDELIVVLDGGCTILDGGPTMTAHDAVVIRAKHPYGFTCGPEGMRFLTIRNGEAGFAASP